MGKMVLVLGGSRSGKSRFAQERASELAPGGRVVYVATAVALDDEMAERIRRHRQDRPRCWRTVDAPLALAEAVRRHGTDADVLLIDCIALWITNLLLRDGDEAALGREDAVLREVRALAATVRDVPAHTLLVSNEVGQGVVPATPLGRVFRDVAGRANQILAAAADEAYVLWAGLPQRLKGAAE